MPWSKDNLPSAVKDKNWTEAQIETFVKTANAVLAETKDEGEAIATGIKMADAKHNDVKRFPEFYYAMHMKQGLARYDDEDIYVDTDAIKRMTPSFNGKPIYVHHQDVNLDKLKEEAVGYVSEAFYNELDGCFWVKMLIVDEEGHNAINRGWAVSNAYAPTHFENAGTNHNLPYDRKIVNGEFTHLAIVPNPRYEDAKILTPDEFKKYQADKKRQLDELKNSKSTTKKGFVMKFWKTKKEEVSSPDVADTLEYTNAKGETVEVSIEEMVNALEGKKEPAKEKTVLVNGKEMPVSELVKAYQKLNEKADEEEKENEEDEEKKNEDKEEEKENEDDEEEMENTDHYSEMKNAHLFPKSEAVQIKTKLNALEQGKAKYGAQK